MTQHLPQTSGDADDDPLGQDRRDRLIKSLQVSGQNPHTMAGALRVHPNTIYNYLNGRTPMNGMAYIAWAAVVGHGVTPEWLEFGHRSPADHPATPDQAVGPAERAKRSAQDKARKLGRDFTDGSGDSDTRRYNEVLQPTG